MYDYGDGVIQNNKKAYVWYAVAAFSGINKAAENRDSIAKSLSSKGLEEAQEEAAKLYKKIYDI